MELEPIVLRSQKKLKGKVSSRSRSVQDTLKTILPVSNNIGITRLADITDMDILGIPNFSAVLPGTEDYIWVYSGKGATKLDAKASALMESIERYCSLPSGNQNRMIQTSYKEVSNVSRTLHPSNVVEPMLFEYDEDMIMDFLSGYDLINSEHIMVPAPLALFRYSPKPPAVNPFAYHHTNGLASGNVLEEAICHSLCEVIERDATSLAEVRARAIPFHFLKTIESKLKRAGFVFEPIAQQNFIDDFTIFRDVELPDGVSKWLRGLTRKFYESDLPLLIKDITSDISIPTFVASSIEWISSNYGYLAEGHGTHPDARIAMTRAITELSQTRAANIHGARDDLRKIHFGENNTDDKRAWQFLPSKEKIRFDKIGSFDNEDILDDIKLILKNLKSVGIGMAAIVDLSNSDIGIPVVRAIVPGLETFKITKSVIGWRA